MYWLLALVGPRYSSLWPFCTNSVPSASLACRSAKLKTKIWPNPLFLLLQLWKHKRGHYLSYHKGSQVLSRLSLCFSNWTTSIWAVGLLQSALGLVCQDPLYLLVSKWWAILLDSVPHSHFQAHPLSRGKLFSVCLSFLSTISMPGGQLDCRWAAMIGQFLPEFPSCFWEAFSLPSC